MLSRIDLFRCAHSRGELAPVRVALVLPCFVCRLPFLPSCLATPRPRFCVLHARIPAHVPMALLIGLLLRARRSYAAPCGRRVTRLLIAQETLETDHCAPPCPVRYLESVVAEGPGSIPSAGWRRIPILSKWSRLVRRRKRRRLDRHPTGSLLQHVTFRSGSWGSADSCAASCPSRTAGEDGSRTPSAQGSQAEVAAWKPGTSPSISHVSLASLTRVA